MSAIHGATKTTAFDRATDPVPRLFSADQARRSAEYGGDESLRRRIEELAARCNEGELADKERAEYEGYVRANQFVALLQAKA